MNEPRDLLAADLHDVAVAAWLDKLMPVAPWPMDKFEWIADRLIALGWTRLDEGVTTIPKAELADLFDRLADEGYKDGIRLADAVAEVVSHWTLDEERLDRAMAVAGVHVDTARPGPTREVGCKSCQKGIIAIAKAYREDTDATD